MRTWIDNKMIEYRLKSNRLLQRLLEEEDGDTNFVSIIVIIVIVLGIATIFRSQLTIAVNNVLSQLTDFIGG